MLEQLLLDSSYFERVFLMLAFILLAFIAAIAIAYTLNALFVDKDIFLGVVTIIIAIIGIYGTNTFGTQLINKANNIKTIQKGHIEDYYNLTKDGKAITFKLKNSKSEYLEKQAEAKIIDEDNKTYQIQYKDTIDRVPKSAVK